MKLGFIDWTKVYICVHCNDNDN